MATIRFTPNLAKHRETPTIVTPGTTVREAVDGGLAQDPLLKSYVLDEQGRLRKHVNIFVDGTMVSDRSALSDPVAPGSEIYIMQALSGG
jgi:hypothetical protein